MVPSSLPDERWIFESQVRECYGRVVYTHKTHLKMADRLDSTQWQLKWGQIVLAAFTSSGALGILFTDGKWLEYATVGISLLAVMLNGYAKDIDPGTAAQQHREAGADIWNLREGYLNLLADTRDLSIPLEELRRRRDKLQDSLHVIYKSAPNTDAKAYAEAQKALQEADEMTFSDEELDKFMPSLLRRSSNVG